MGKSSPLARQRCCVAHRARPKFLCFKQNWEAWSRDDIVAMMFIYNGYCLATSLFNKKQGKSAKVLVTIDPPICTP